MNVTQTPLVSLRTEDGLPLRRVRDVVTGDVKALLSSAVVRFVIAEVGKPLRWISEEERFRFWKADAQAHIADEEKRCLDDSPGGYFYFASEWHSKHAAKPLSSLKSSTEEEPNQSPEPTTTAGTSPAAQARVPAAVVAHL